MTPHQVLSAVAAGRAVLVCAHPARLVVDGCALCERDVVAVAGLVSSARPLVVGDAAAAVLTPAGLDTLLGGAS